jgi:pimeloyl-ACP methyl ester carboxylesterase
MLSKRGFLSYRLTKLLCVLVLLSCSSEEDKPFVPVPCDTFTKLLFVRDVDIEEIISYTQKRFNVSDEQMEVYQSDIRVLKKLIPSYKAYGIAYRTVTPDGKSVEASGTLYYPVSKQAKRLMEISSILMDKHFSVLDGHYSPEIIIGLLGDAVLVPELIGIGQSKDYPISYMMYDNIGRVSADLRAAAREFVHNELRRELPRTSIICGYSLGGGNAWALARYYSQHPECEVDVTNIYVGGGCYYPSLAIREYVKSNKATVALIPNCLYSADYYLGLGLDFSRIFRGDLLQNYPSWCDGGLSYDDFINRIGTQLDQYLNLDFFQPGYSPVSDSLLAVVKRMDIPNDWMPQVPVRIYHCTDDTCVPNACSDSLYAYLKQGGANVTYIEPTEENHWQCGFNMFIDVVKRNYNLK